MIPKEEMGFAGRQHARCRNLLGSSAGLGYGLIGSQGRTGKSRWKRVVAGWELVVRFVTDFRKSLTAVHALA